MGSDGAIEAHHIPGNWGTKVADGDMVQAGDLLAKRGDQQVIAQSDGMVSLGCKVFVIWEHKEEYEYEIPSAARLLVEEAQRIEAGTQLTEGSQNPHRILSILGREATQHYLLQEVQRVYRSQGVNINEKHFEVILRKMLSKVGITSTGDSEYLVGELIDRLALSELNEKLLAEGRKPAQAKPVLLGITKAALSTDSFLSASSFQHTIKVLAWSAIEGKKDDLTGLKENVIIGKLIPAGTGYYIHKQREEAVKSQQDGDEEISLDVEGIFDHPVESELYEESDEEEVDMQDTESDELEMI
jgi:DNA-directed RNA polymerase subunit beta'